MIRTGNDALNFLEGRLAYLKSLHMLDILPKERRERERLEHVLGPVEGRRKAPDLMAYYEEHYRGRDVYVPANCLPEIHQDEASY